MSVICLVAKLTTAWFADAGSPSSSTSCHEAQPGFVGIADSRAKAPSYAANIPSQAERPLPVRRRHSRKPAKPVLPMVTDNSAFQGLPQQAPLAQVSTEDKPKRNKPKKQWEVCASNFWLLIVSDCKILEVLPCIPRSSTWCCTAG